MTHSERPGPMSTLPPGVRSSSPVPWGLGLAAAGLAVMAAGVLLWSNQSDETSFLPPPEGPPASVHARVVPSPIPPGPVPGNGLHMVAYMVENGTQVVKIRVTEYGDELVVDASTGKLLETRPGRPIAPAHMGKAAGPAVPMT